MDRKMENIDNNKKTTKRNSENNLMEGRRKRVGKGRKTSKMTKIKKIEEFDMSSEDKPPFSYAILIGVSILSSQNKCSTLLEIYQWISETFKFYKRRDMGWQNSIRHNLSLNDAFVKGEKSKNGKGHFWLIRSDCEKQFSIYARDYETESEKKDVTEVKWNFELNEIENNENHGILNQAKTDTSFFKTYEDILSSEITQMMPGGSESDIKNDCSLLLQNDNSCLSLDSFSDFLNFDVSNDSINNLPPHKHFLNSGLFVHPELLNCLHFDSCESDSPFFQDFQFPSFPVLSNHNM